MMILIARITILYWTCICIFLYEDCFAYVVKPRRRCVCILSTTIAGVSFIICGKFYFRHFLANSCLVLTVWILLDVRVS